MIWLILLLILFYWLDDLVIIGEFVREEEVALAQLLKCIFFLKVLYVIFWLS